MEFRTERLKLVDIRPATAKTLAQRLHRKAADIELVRKGIPVDPESITINDGERSAIRYITTPDLDRDSEILLPDGAVLDDFRDSPSVLFAHDYHALPIGKDLWLKVTKRGILAKTKYATHQMAEDVYQCVKGGFLNTSSVGFIPVDSVSMDGFGDADPDAFLEERLRLERDYDVPMEATERCRRIYRKWILLEHSDVPVPSNPRALNIAVKSGALKIESKELLAAAEAGAEEKIDIDPATLSVELTPVPMPEPPAEPVIEPMPDPALKPETTNDYHRIPVSVGHDGHEIRTITISSDRGIKALYCVTCKKIATYLFDVDKWTMEEAQAWVNAHKDTVAIVAEVELAGAARAEKIEAEFRVLAADIEKLRDAVARLALAFDEMRKRSDIESDDKAQSRKTEPARPAENVVEAVIERVMARFDGKAIGELVADELARIRGKLR